MNLTAGTVDRLMKSYLRGQPLSEIYKKRILAAGPIIMLLETRLRITKTRTQIIVHKRTPLKTRTNLWRQD